MTLSASLEELARLGAEYHLWSGGEEWTAKKLLAWLENGHPDLLSLPVALVPPDDTGEGVVFEVNLEGQPLTDVPLYRIKRRTPVQPL
jgi:hypothetical protein